MSVLVFVDTHVHLHAVDDRDLARQAGARTWLSWCWSERVGRVSTQVLNEFYNHAITRFRDSAPVQQARAQIRQLRHWMPPHLDTHTIDGAWALQDRYALSYWDALIVSSAQQQGCRYLLSEELTHLQQFEAVQVLNPFLVGPQDLPIES